MKVGVLKLDPSGPSLEEVSQNGWNIVVAETAEGRSFGAGNCHRVDFKDSAEKHRIPAKYQQQGWALWGPYGYLVIGTPEDSILQIIKQYFAEATFYDAATKQEMILG